MTAYNRSISTVLYTHTNPRIMRFKIDNIGKLQNAEIELDGITVVAGRNNTGKSTFGKALFCLFHAFFDESDSIQRERTKELESIIFRTVGTGAPQMRVHSFAFSRKVSTTVRTILEGISPSLKDGKSTRENIENALKTNFQDSIEDATLSDLCNSIVRALTVDDNRIQSITLAKYFSNALSSKATHVNYPEKYGSLSLRIQGKEINVIINDGDVKFETNIGLTCDAFYINTPFIWDTLDDMYRGRNPRSIRGKYGYKAHLLDNLIDSGEDNGVISEVVNKERLGKIFAFLRTVVDGEFVVVDGELRYQEAGLKDLLEFSAVSAGVKSFLTIKRLLETGKINDKYVIILDEPEVHLHPEW